MTVHSIQKLHILAPAITRVIVLVGLIMHTFCFCSHTISIQNRMQTFVPLNDCVMKTEHKIFTDAYCTCTCLMSTCMFMGPFYLNG